MSHGHRCLGAQRRSMSEICHGVPDAVGVTPVGSGPVRWGFRARPPLRSGRLATTKAEVGMLSAPGTLRTTAALPVERLRWTCDPADLAFESTHELPPLDG